MNERLCKAFNCIVVELIPKSDKTIYIKDYMPISVCTTVYKIISKVLTTKLGMVLGSIIGHCQTAFVPEQQIHNHVLLAYEMIKVYARNEGSPDV